MSAEQQAPAVVPFARPPIRKSVLVRRPREIVFDSFVDTIAQWWPVTPFSSGGDRIVAVTFERALGGRIYETWDDGSHREWGIVIDWVPPERFTMTWNVTAISTDVDLTFTAVADELTRVDLVHRGWERLSEAELGEDCALPGGYRGGSFDKGWTIILDRFVDHLEGTDPRKGPQDA